MRSTSLKSGANSANLAAGWYHVTALYHGNGQFDMYGNDRWLATASDGTYALNGAVGYGCETNAGRIRNFSVSPRLRTPAMPGRAALSGKRITVQSMGKIIAFAYWKEGFDPKSLKSVTIVGPTEDWPYWRERGVLAARGHTWMDLLRSPVETAADNLTGGEGRWEDLSPMGKVMEGNPSPAVMIDEFGFDYGGGMDEKSARILLLAKKQRPELSLLVWHMRGPIPPVLGQAYKDATDLIMFESYLHNKKSYWWIASQVWSARRLGLMAKTIVMLGVGEGGNAGENWADTKEELERQIRFVRYIAPESPGIGFYGGTPELLKYADELCEHLADLPVDGKDLPEDVLALGKFYGGKYDKPTLLVSPALVQPNYKDDGSGRLEEPKTFRPYIINLGDRDARNIKVRLRNPPAMGGNVFAEGVIPFIPKHDAAIGILPVLAEWKVWVGQWVMEVDAPGCDVFMLR